MAARTITAGLAPFEPAAGVWELLAPGASARAARADDESRVEIDWDELMRRHGRRVVVTLLARGIAADRAHDLAQEAWLKIMAQHRAGRLVELKMPGLVVTQAIFLARDEFRRARRRDRAESSAPVDDATADDADLERRIEARQQLRVVLDVVARSYPNARRVFALAYGPRAKKASEIAEDLGLSQQRVRQILCELRARMRDELGVSR